MTTRLYGMGTQVPPHTAPKDQLHRFLRRVVEARAPREHRPQATAFLDSVHEGSGIEHRYTVIEDFTKSDPERFEFFPKNWRLEPFPSTRQRMQLYEDASVDLAETACRKALADADIDADEVTHLVVVTCTGLFAPGPDILLVDRLGLRPGTRRTVIGFMGCYGAFNGLRTASQIIAADPDAVVVNVCIELCSLHYQLELDPQLMVGNCLFGDGCAAAVYAAPKRLSGGLCDLVGEHCHITHDSLEQMQWHVGDHGFSMVLDVEIPSTLLRGGSKFIDTLVESCQMQRADVDAWVIHPGGPRIIDAVRDAAGLEESRVAVSRSVLRDFGNMSSPTVLFVLERQLEHSSPGDRLAMLGFGPGLTMEGAVLRAI